MNRSMSHARMCFSFVISFTTEDEHDGRSFLRARTTGIVDE